MKRFTSGILSIAIVLSFLFFVPTKVEAATNGISGSCTWSLDGTVLTISGSGQMASYYSNGYLTTAPWGDEVSHVIIENGVTNVGQYAFYGCKKLQSASLPGSVKTIDRQAFDRSGIKSISLSEGLTTIYDGAFNTCTSLYSIVLPNSLTYIADYAFQSCPMTDIVFSTNLKHIGRSAFNYGRITDVWYLGDYNDKAVMTINGYNACLNTATWHYNSCPINAHSYDNVCDANCNVCEYIRTVPEHIFDNVCDIECNACGFARTVPDHNFTINGNHSCNICKYSKVPNAPVVENKTHNSVTLVFTDGLEYSKDGTIWQDSNVFTNLMPDTNYTFYQRVKESNVALVSETSSMLMVKTDMEPVYTVIFVDWNETVLSIETYHYGDEVTAPADPIKTADNTYTYVFAGWNKDVVNCAGDATYTATYTPIYKDYAIIFADEDGTELSKRTYHWGDKVSTPVDPTKSADNTYTYVFAGWDKAVVNCAGDATYTATYKRTYVDYTVIFVDIDGTELSKQTYHWGDRVFAPANPTKTADDAYIYTFAGWDQEVINCDGDKVYTATYQRRQFADITITSWQYAAAKYAVERNLMAGKGTDEDGNIKFDPNSPITREEFVQVLYNAEGKPPVTIENPFPDVKNDWYKNAVLWANQAGIASGMGNGNFGVGMNITRQDLALMLYKYAAMKNLDLTAPAGEIDQYADGSRVSGYAQTAMNWAVKNGVLSGKGVAGKPLSTFNLDPTGAATRAECAAMLKNFMTAFGL